MNKKELISQVAEKTGVTQKNAQMVIDATTKIITECLSREEKLLLVGFGSFQVMQRKAREGVNPQTRKKIHIPAKKVPKFRPGGTLKDAVS